MGLLGGHSTLSSVRDNELIRELSKRDVIFTGGVVELLHGIKDFTHDIDVFVDDYTILNDFGHVYRAKDPLNMVETRGILPKHKYLIDIFVNPSIKIDFEVIDDLKIQTLESLLQFKLHLFANNIKLNRLSKINLLKLELSIEQIKQKIRLYGKYNLL